MIPVRRHHIRRNRLPLADTQFQDHPTSVTVAPAGTARGRFGQQRSGRSGPGGGRRIFWHEVGEGAFLAVIGQKVDHSVSSALFTVPGRSVPAHCEFSNQLAEALRTRVSPVSRAEAHCASAGWSSSGSRRPPAIEHCLLYPQRVEGSILRKMFVYVMNSRR